MKKCMFYIFLLVFSFSVSGENNTACWDGRKESFIELPIDRQVEIYVDRFSNNFGFGSRVDFDIAFEILSNSVDSRTEPILVGYIGKCEYIYRKRTNQYEAQLSDLKLANLAFLIANKVNVTHTFDLDSGASFGQLFREKVKDYISSFNRIDTNCEEAINYIFTMENRLEQFPRFTDSDYYPKVGKLMYNFLHEELNIDLSAVGLGEKYVFPGYSGNTVE